MSQGLTKDALEKGLKRLEEAAQPPAQARAAELFNKAQDGTITPEEREELVKSVSTDLGAQATEKMVGNETIQKSLNVSDYLKEQHAALVHGFETVADHIQKSEGTDQEFRVALATTLFHTGELIKSQDARLSSVESLLKGISDRLGIIAAQPARGPKSQAAAAAVAQNSEGLNKSFAGAAPAGEQLSKSQILDGMSDMLMKGQELVAGENLMLAATKYESLNEISPSMLKSVQEHVRGKKLAA